jgi:hypothetical protein
MKILILIGLFIGALAVGIVIGGLSGARFEARVLGRMEVANHEVDEAFLAAEQDEWAAQLRLGQVTNTITDLEESANSQVAALAAWDYVAPPDEQIKKARDRFLTSVKTYEESYPAIGTDGDDIRSLLSSVPGRSPQNTCKNGICQLNNLRIAELQRATNSP